MESLCSRKLLRRPLLRAQLGHTLLAGPRGAAAFSSCAHANHNLERTQRVEATLFPLRSKYYWTTEGTGKDEQVRRQGTRWNPTKEQLRALEELYARGTRTPSAHQIQLIAAQLRRYGRIEGKNVFYWFQNHKARERQRRCRQVEEEEATAPAQAAPAVDGDHQNKLQDSGGAAQAVHSAVLKQESKSLAPGKSWGRSTSAASSATAGGSGEKETAQSQWLLMSHGQSCRRPARRDSTCQHQQPRAHVPVTAAASSSSSGNNTSHSDIHLKLSRACEALVGDLAREEEKPARTTTLELFPIRRENQHHLCSIISPHVQFFQFL